MIIWMNWGLGAKFTAQYFDSAVRDDFIDVHVSLGSRASLPNNQGEVILELALDDLYSYVLIKIKVYHD